MALTVTALDHVVINVADVEASAAWYVSALGVTREDTEPGPGRPKRTAIRFGHQKINLRPAGADTVEWFTGRAVQPGSDDLCFLTDAAPEAVAAHFNALGIAVEEGPVTKQGARGPIRSVYCRDPDGNLVEVASHPGRTVPLGPT